MPVGERVGLMPGWRVRLNAVAGILLFGVGVSMAVSEARYLVVAAGAGAGMVAIWILRGRVVRPINFAIAGALGGLLVDKLLPLPAGIVARLNHDPWTGLWTGLLLGIGPGLALEAWTAWRAKRTAAPVTTE